MTAPPGLGEADVDAAAVVVAQRALDQAVLFQPADQAGQRALAQVHRLGQFLDPELVPWVLGEPLQHLELGNPEPVPFAQVMFEGRGDRGVARHQRAPLADEFRYPGLLIAARLVKGMAAAFTAPAGLSIITTTFAEGPARNRALSIYSAFGAGGFSLGLVLSGLLTEINWRWTLLLPAPVAAVILIAGLRLIPRADSPETAGPRDHARHGAAPPARRGFDLLGAATVTGGMLLLVYAVVSAPQAGWTSPRTLISFAAAAALLGAFVAVERRSRDPLVRLGIFRSGELTRANLGAMVLFGSYVSFQFLVTQYLQIMAGWSALGTALAFLPAGVLVAAASPRMGQVLDRFGPARVVAVGFACLAAGYAWFLRVGPAPDYPAVILPSLLLIGAAFGLGFASLNVQATAGVADHEQGLASGILQTSFQLGGAIVLAVVTAVIDARGADHAVSAGVTLAAYRPALGVITGVAVLGLAVTLAGLRAPRPRPATAPDAAATDMAQDEAELERVTS